MGISKILGIYAFIDIKADLGVIMGDEISYPLHPDGSDVHEIHPKGANVAKETCFFCKKGEQIDFPGSEYREGIRIEGHKLIVSCWDGYTDWEQSYDISFCPICGDTLV